MKYLGLVFVLVAAVIPATFGQKEAGPSEVLSESVGARISHGDEASKNQFPWQVSVGQAKDDFITSYCGGSLIHDKWVLTAAHCASSAPEFDVYLGSTVWKAGPEDGGVVVHTSTVVIHPQYNPDNLNNNIALLGLPEPVALSDAIQPIRLPNATDYLYAGHKVTISGFGWSDSHSNTLHYTTLLTVSNRKCKVYYEEDQITESTLCALNEQDQGPCHGDFGGPLVLYDKDKPTILVGVASFVHLEGCQTHNPSGYVRPELYLGWINEVTGLQLPA